MPTTEVAAFASSIRSIVADHSSAGAWRPGSLGDDQLPVLRHHLHNAGWHDLGEDPQTLPFVGPAAVELGRSLVALSELDALLGGSPYLSGMTRYADVGDRVVIPGQDGIRMANVVAADPVPYGDCIGACRTQVSDGELLRPDEARVREDMWVAGTVGYIAGMTAEALRIALDHTTKRQAFGKTLAGLDSVQQRLADAALCADGLLLLAEGAPDMDALAYAGPASCAAIAECHQVVGAIGYTLEFPLQRFSRRARAMHLWADAWIEARS
jgi:butyryl-CoA dehydrogenase